MQGLWDAFFPETYFWEERQKPLRPVWLAMACIDVALSALLCSFYFAAQPASFFSSWGSRALLAKLVLSISATAGLLRLAVVRRLGRAMLRRLQRRQWSALQFVPVFIAFVPGLALGLWWATDGTVARWLALLPRHALSGGLLMVLPGAAAWAFLFKTDKRSMRRLRRRRESAAGRRGL